MLRFPAKGNAGLTKYQFNKLSWYDISFNEECLPDEVELNADSITGFHFSRIFFLPYSFLGVCVLLLALCVSKLVYSPPFSN